MSFRSSFRTLTRAKYCAHLENGTIHLLIQIIHSHTIDSFQNPTETLPQFIDKYLSPVNIHKRKQASKLLREMVKQIFLSENWEVKDLEILEAIRRWVGNFVQEYSFGRSRKSEEYANLLSHLWKLYNRCRNSIFRRAGQCVFEDSYEWFGGVYLFLDILLLDYHLNIKHSGSLESWESDNWIVIRKHTLYLLSDALCHERKPTHSVKFSTVRELFSNNRRLISILLQMLDGRPEKHLTNLYINQRIFQIFFNIMNYPPNYDLNLENLSRLRECGAVEILRNFCEIVQDTQSFNSALRIYRFIITENNREFFQHLDSSMDLLFNSLEIPFDMRPENNRIRIFVRRACQRILSRKMFCFVRETYRRIAYTTWVYPAHYYLALIVGPVFLRQNSESGWKSELIQMMLKRLNYFYTLGSERNLLNVVQLVICVVQYVHRYPAALERLRQGDICAKLVEILAIERTEPMLQACVAMKHLTTKSMEAAEPERRRLRELRAVERLKKIVKYSGKGEEIYNVALKVLDNLSVENDNNDNYQ